VAKSARFFSIAKLTPNIQFSSCGSINLIGRNLDPQAFMQSTGFGLGPT
jgi:hypothetical protein